MKREPGVEVVRYEDPALGQYKKLLLKDNRLHGMILVGDIEDEAVYMDWMRQRNGSGSMRRQLLFPPPAATSGSKWPICRTAKPSADATASARAKSSRRYTNTASRRWAS